MIVFACSKTRHMTILAKSTEYRFFDHLSLASIPIFTMSGRVVDQLPNDYGGSNTYTRTHNVPFLPSVTRTQRNVKAKTICSSY